MSILAQQAKQNAAINLGSKPLLIDWLNKWRDSLKEEREGNAVDSQRTIKCSHENGAAID